jgi:hypothetical protein
MPSTLDDGSVNNLIADLFVTKPTTYVSWQGEWDFTYDSGTPENVCWGTPEPSTLALLASGLIGLVCCAWWKRK